MKNDKCVDMFGALYSKRILCTRRKLCRDYTRCRIDIFTYRWSPPIIAICNQRDFPFLKADNSRSFDLLRKFRNNVAIFIYTFFCVYRFNFINDILMGHKMHGKIATINTRLFPIVHNMHSFSGIISIILTKLDIPARELYIYKVYNCFHFFVAVSRV